MNARIACGCAFVRLCVRAFVRLCVRAFVRSRVCAFAQRLRCAFLCVIPRSNIPLNTITTVLSTLFRGAEGTHWRA